MGMGLARLHAPEVKAKLSETQWEYLAFGPYPHWTRTRVALVKKGLYEADGKTRTFLGDAVHEIIQRDLQKPKAA